MQGSRRLWIIIGVVIVAALALLGFYIWLVGGTSAGSQEGEGDVPAASDGLVHVRSIYTYADNANIVRPVGIGADQDGNFFVTLVDSATIIEFDSSGDYVRHWGKRGTDPGELLSPTGVAVDRLSGHVYVADRARLKLITYSLDGTFLWEVPVLNPVSVEVDPEGQVVLSTFGPIAIFSSEGEYLGEVGTRGEGVGQFDYPRQTVTAEDNAVYVADSNNTRVQSVLLEGEATATVNWVVGEKPRDAEDPSGRFGLPTGIALDTTGRVVVMDSFRSTIELLGSEAGDSVTDFGGERRGTQDGMFNFPTNVVHLSGDLFAITDTGNDRIQIVRLIGPDDRQPWNLWPALRWLALLPLLLLLLLFGRRRVFITEESLTRAIDEENARLVLSATKGPFALPDSIERHGDAYEAEVRIGDHLREVDAPSGDVDDAETRLADASRKTVLQRLLLRRHRIVGADEDQCVRMEEEGLKVWSYDAIIEEYSIEE